MSPVTTFYDVVNKVIPGYPVSGLFIGCMLFLTTAVAQDLKVTYHRTINEPVDLTGVDAKNRALIEKALANDTNKVYVFELLIGGGKSKYHFQGYLNPKPGSSFYSHTYYKRLGSNEVIADSPMLKKGEGLKSSLSDHQWAFHDETKFVLGYLCRKATTSEGTLNYTVWYAESLPYPDGPDNFGGLPGLILQMERKGDIVTAVSINAQPSGTYIIQIPEFEKYLKFEAFKKRIGF